MEAEEHNVSPEGLWKKASRNTYLLRLEVEAYFATLSVFLHTASVVILETSDLCREMNPGLSVDLGAPDRKCLRHSRDVANESKHSLLRYSLNLTRLGRMRYSPRTTMLRNVATVSRCICAAPISPRPFGRAPTSPGRVAMMSSMVGSGDTKTRRK